MTERMIGTAVALLVWGLAGAVFGGLFVGLYQILALLGLSGWQPLVAGSVAAAMTTAAFYSAMPLALVGTAAGVVSSIGYLIVTGPGIELSSITLIAAAAGIVAGASFAWTERQNARPLAETLTGMLAGVGAGLVLVLVLAFSPWPIDAFVMAAGVVALVGTLFQLNEHWIVQACHGWLPDRIAAPFVAALISAVVASGVWLMAGMSSPMVAGAGPSLASGVLEEIPSGALGGLLGGAVAGLLLELLGFRLEERGLG
jgi:hypothetical protein